MVGRIWKILKNEITDFEFVTNDYVTHFHMSLTVFVNICHHRGQHFFYSAAWPRHDFLSDPVYGIMWKLSNK